MIPKETQNKKHKNNNKNKTQTNAMKKAEEAVEQLRSAAKGDMLGSYTGVFYDGSEPDQDADDL